MDMQILYAIQRFANPFWDTFFKGVTFLGNGGLIWLAIGVILLARRDTREAGILMFVSLGVTSLFVNLGLKPLVGRTRPYIAAHRQIIIAPPGGSSFPSGHTAAAFASAWAIFCYYKERRPHKRWLILIPAVLIAFSRLYLFVHYPTDVLAGMIFGIDFASLVVYFAPRVQTRLQGESS